MKISLFIPTYNACKYHAQQFKNNLSIIKNANLHRVLIIDSDSSDETREIVSSFGFECIVILQSQFDHGGTRSMALNLLSDSDIIVYLTQDAFLVDVESITNLSNVLCANDQVVACYGRQLPNNDADIFARHLREFNYKKASYIRKYSDRYVWGMRAIFSSDSFAAYKVRELKSIGGFPEHIIFGEDAYVFAKLLQSGYKVAYSAEAVCHHSHNYRVWDEFRRYFDIGVFHRSENWILQDFGTATKDGLKFIISEIKYLAKRRPWLIPKSLAKIMAKYLGYKLGYNYDYLGVRLCRKLTMNKSFWW